MMKNKISLALYFILFFWFSSGFSQPPAGYYDAAAGLSWVPLKQALHDIIKNHTISTYTPGVWNAFYSTDDKPNQTVWDIYSDIPDGTPNGNPPYVYQFGSDQCGTASKEGDCYSREHSWPKSWFGGEVLPMYTDLFILYPVDQYVNLRRSDNPYGVVGTATWTSQNGSKLGNCITSGYTDKVFEPIDEYKGDLARTYFYMSVRYYTEDSAWPGSPMAVGSQMNSWAQTMMMQWSLQDPVSPKEIERNNAVYAIQQNRNPFIDHPEYANGIWGSGMGIDPSSHALKKLKIVPDPVISICTVTLPDGFQVNESRIRIYYPAGGIANVPVSSGNHDYTLNFSGWPSGLYLVSVIGNENQEVYYGKIIKQ